MALAQRFNINDLAVNGTEAGTNLSLNDIVPMQPVTKGTAADDNKLTLMQLQSIPYGAASLSGSTYTVTLLNYPMDFTLKVGSKMVVKFNTAKSGSAVLNLSINGQTVPMQMQGVPVTEIAANQILEFTFIGTIVDGVHEVTHANASAGISASQLNGALTDLDNLAIDVTKSNANECIPTRNIETKTFRVPYNGENLPIAINGNIVVQRHWTQVIQIYSPYNNSGKTYKRMGTFSNDIWTFTNWIESATKIDLENYVYIDGETLVIGDDEKKYIEKNHIDISNDITTKATTTTLMENASYKVGNVVFLSFRFKTTVDINAYTSILNVGINNYPIPNVLNILSVDDNGTPQGLYIQFGNFYCRRVLPAGTYSICLSYVIS